MGFEATIPHDHDAEAAVLGAMMVDPETVWRLVDVLRPEDFYSEPNRLAYDALTDVALNGSGPVDVIRLRRVIEDRGQLDRVGGVSYLAGLVDGLPDVGNAEHYAAIVAELARRRQILATSQRAASAVAGGDDSSEVAGWMLGDIADLTTRGRRGHDGGDLGNLVRTAAQTALEIHRKGAGAFGLLTGIDQVDELLQGLKVGMYVLAARPGTGKSALADQLAVKAASTTGKPVLVLITEMSPAQRAARQLAAVTGVPLPRIHGGRFTVAERERIERVSRAEVDFPRVRLESAVGKTAAQVRLMVRRFVAAEGTPALVVVDYLQQLRAANPRASMNERTGEKSSQLNELAQDIQTPVLVCSQLSREVEKERRPPRLSDLRESGEIEQDAYVVAFLHRPDPEDHERVLFLLEKHRDGPTGVAGLRFRPSEMRFEGVERR